MAGKYVIRYSRKGPVVVTTVAGQPPIITLADGRRIVGERADKHGGVFENRGESDTGGLPQYQWVIPGLPPGQQFTVTHGGSTSSPVAITPSQEVRSDTGGLGGLRAAPNKAMGQIGAGGFGASPVGQFGFAPANLMGSYPTPFLADYQPIQSAPYNFTDVKKFAKEFGAINRGEINKNYLQSKELALDTLGTELQSLTGYVPAAAALKRQETAADNVFNQQQRTQQLDTVLPNVRGQLFNQGQRAETFANGSIPDPIQDRAYELGIRSGAADIANAGGFGARSSVARKASDLMSAKERLQLSQYGDSLLTGNINQRANIELAPTSYSNAGQQVNVMPSASFSQLSQSNLGQINNATLMPTATAFSGQVQQNQFVTGQEQQTRQFNATNQLQNSQFNANVQNQNAIGQFGYGVGLAGAYAGAAQTDLNTGVALDQQAQSQQNFQTAMGNTQSNNQTGSIFQGAGALIPSVLGLFGGSDTSSGGFAGGTGSDTPLPSSLDTPAFGLDSGGSSSIDLGVDTTLRSSTPQTAAARSFTKGTAAPTTGSFTAVPSTAALRSAGTSALAMAGLYNSPQPGTVPVGVDNSGNQMYASARLLKSDDLGAGAQALSGIKDLVFPFNVLSPTDEQNLDGIIGNISDATTIAALTDAAAKKDQTAFVNAALKLTKQPVSEYVSSKFTNPKEASQAAGAVSSVYTATQLFQNWGQMSPAQKTLGLSALAIHGYKTASGVNLANEHVIKPQIGADGSVASAGMTVGQGLDLLSAGYNAYALAQNWGQLDTLQKAIGGASTAVQLASTAKSMGLLGFGETGAAVPGVTAESLSSIGAQAVPQYGIGAQAIPAGSSVPAGYTGVASTAEGGTIIIPEANAASAAPGILQTAGGVASLAAGAYTVYQGWGGTGTKGATNGALGGAAMAAGLYALGATNPVLLGAVVAASVISNASGGAKSEDQLGRDSVRKLLKKSGLVNDKYEVNLADGSVANLGIDGHGESHSVTDPSLLSAEQKGKVKKLSSFDVDYTNDLDFAASMGGMTLSRLLSGGAAKNVDQIGGQIGNASLKGIGYNQQMTEDNFNRVMKNQRGMFSQVGIKSRDDAMQLANQAYAEGRIDDIQHTSALQSINMIFNDGSYRQAKQLMAGRNQGIQAAAKLPVNAEPQKGNVVAFTKNISPSSKFFTKPSAAKSSWARA